MTRLSHCLHGMPLCSYLDGCLRRRGRTKLDNISWVCTTAKHVSCCTRGATRKIYCPFYHVHTSRCVNGPACTHRASKNCGGKARLALAKKVLGSCNKSVLELLRQEELGSEDRIMGGRGGDSGLVFSVIQVSVEGRKHKIKCQKCITVAVSERCLHCT